MCARVCACVCVCSTNAGAEQDVTGCGSRTTWVLGAELPSSATAFYTQPASHRFSPYTILRHEGRKINSWKQHEWRSLKQHIDIQIISGIRHRSSLGYGSVGRMFVQHIVCLGGTLASPVLHKTRRVHPCNPST